MSDYGATSIDEGFGNGLDENVWLPAYLPAWSSRAAAAADWSVSERGLVLRIGAGHPLWCPQDHQPPLRVSAVQSANWSGPVGSTLGQQPFRPGQRVRETQPEMWGLTPLYGTVEVTCRADIDEASMFSAWMIGLEDLPSRCGEICLVEVFGSTVRSGPGGTTAAVGRGIHAFRDPALAEDFAAPVLPLDPAGLHSYAVDWTPQSVRFSVDGEQTHVSAPAPAYPMQLILGVFDFPGQHDPGVSSTARFTPRLHVTRVRVTQPTPA